MVFFLRQVIWFGETVYALYRCPDLSRPAELNAAGTRPSLVHPVTSATLGVEFPPPTVATVSAIRLPVPAFMTEVLMCRFPMPTQLKLVLSANYTPVFVIIIVIINLYSAASSYFKLA